MALDRWLVESTVELEEMVGLACGRDYDLLLLRGDTVLSYTADATGQTAALGQLEGLDASTVARVVDYLGAPTGVLAAVALAEERRVLLVLPAVGADGGEGVGILPRADGGAVVRVLDRVLGERTAWLTARPAPLRGAGARGDEGREREDRLEGLLRSGLFLLDYRAGKARRIAVSDRRKLSFYLCALLDLLHVFLDGTSSPERPRPFPIAYPFHGTFCPAQAAWTLLCFVLGQRRALPPSRYPAHMVADHERLLPMVEIAAGNRTRSPSEWQECARMAERLGIFFDVRRTRHSILVRLCPFIPASEREFAVRAPLAAELWRYLSSQKRDVRLDKAGGLCYTVNDTGDFPTESSEEDT